MHPKHPAWVVAAQFRRTHSIHTLSHLHSEASSVLQTTNIVSDQPSIDCRESTPKQKETKKSAPDNESGTDPVLSYNVHAKYVQTKACNNNNKNKNNSSTNNVVVYRYWRDVQKAREQRQPQTRSGYIHTAHQPFFTSSPQYRGDHSDYNKYWKGITRSNMQRVQHSHSNQKLLILPATFISLSTIFFCSAHL